MTTVILFVLGVIVGSFLNVVGIRFNSGLSLNGRSFCLNCGKKLHFYELVPIVSFIFLRGRCSGCRSAISWQYPLVELWTGLVFVSVYNFKLLFLPEFSLAHITQTSLMLTVFCLYISIAVYDLRHKIIPDLLVYLSIVVALVYRLIQVDAPLDWFAGPILFVFFALIWFISRGRAMGFGDAKLALSIGILLGAAYAFSAIILAFWIGAVFGLGYMAYARLSPLLRSVKRITIKSELPFAPFMILGAWLSIVWHLDLLYVTFF